MKKISIMLLALVVALASCKKTPEVNLKYVDVERDLVTVGTTTANIQCDYEYIATLKKAYFFYGEGETNMNSAEMRVVQNTLYVELVGLSENTTYNYYYEFHNGFNSMRTVLKTFKTEAGNGGGNEPPTPEITLPTVITASVTEITTNSAKGGGEVTNDGGAEVTERGICWSTNANPTLNDSHIAIGTGIGEFNATVSGLDENTTYHIRAYAINEKGTAYGMDREFTTLPNGGTVQLPVVVTNEVTGITAHSATCGGEVTNDGGAEVTERGICWGTSENPTLSDGHVVAGNGVGTFAAIVTGLNANTTYHVRAYATNEAGTAYGLDREFTTLEGGGSGEVPTGAINGLFTINQNGYQVYFSQGNLQYRATTNTWRFAENQWDYVGGYELGTVYENGVKCDNSLISSSYDGWIDLFGWGTSGWDNGNVYYQPYDYEYLSDWNAYDYGYGYGPTDGTNYTYSLTGIYADADWGVYNSIINGDNTPNKWHVLKRYEMDYLINRRTTPSGIRYAKAIVNGVGGIILLPDDWTPTVYALNYPNRPEAPYAINEITAELWTVLEINGAVFLPSSGYRLGLQYFITDISVGQYWLASYTSLLSTTAGSDTFYFYNSDGSSAGLSLDINAFRYAGLAVRLVQDANK